MALEDFLTGAENVAGWPLFLVNALLSMRSGGLQNMLMQRAQLAGTPSGQAMLSGHPFLAGMAGYGTTSAPPVTTLPPGGGGLVAPQPTGRHVDLPPLPAKAQVEQFQDQAALEAMMKIRADPTNATSADYQRAGLPVPMEVQQREMQALTGGGGGGFAGPWRQSYTFGPSGMSTHLSQSPNAAVKTINGWPSMWNPQTNQWERMPVQGMRGGTMSGPAPATTAQPWSPPAAAPSAGPAPSAPRATAGTPEAPHMLGPQTRTTRTARSNQFGPSGGSTSTSTGPPRILSDQVARAIIAQHDAGMPVDPQEYEAALNLRKGHEADKAMTPNKAMDILANKESTPEQKERAKKFLAEEKQRQGQKLGEILKRQREMVASSRDVAADLLTKLDDPKFADAKRALGPSLNVNLGGFAAGPSQYNITWRNYKEHGGLGNTDEQNQLMEAIGYYQGTGFQAFLNGIRNKIIADDIRVHIPEPWDEERTIRSKIKYLTGRYDDIVKNLGSGGEADINDEGQGGAGAGTTGAPKVMSGSWGQGQTNAP